MRISKVNFLRVGVGLGFSVLAVYLRVQSFIEREWNGDELFELHLFAGPFKPFWKNIKLVTSGDHTAFPGEYLATYPMMTIFGADHWGLVIPRVVMLFLGIYFFYRICDKYFKTTAGFVVAFALYCFNNELIYHAIELRPYSVLPTLALGVFFFSHKIVERYRDLSFLEKCLIGLFFFIVINYHAYGIIIFAFPVFFVVWADSRFNPGAILTKEYVKFFTAVLIAAMPFWCWYAVVNKFGANNGLENGSFGDTFRFIPHPLVDPIAFLKFILGNLAGYCKPLYVLLPGLGIAFLLPHKDRLAQFFFFLILVVLPVSCIFLVDVVSQYWFIQRQFVWVMPLFAMGLGWQWDSIVDFVREKLCARHWSQAS